MVLYTECVAERGAPRDGVVRIRRRQSGVGARDGTPPVHPALCCNSRRRACASSGTIERLQWSFRWHLPS